MFLKMLRHVLILFTVAATILGQPVIQQRSHPDAGLNVLEIIEKRGYPIERHQDIQTEDGYLLEIHRIPFGINNSTNIRKGPILLMHGMSSSSADWANTEPRVALAYILADLGYDVWLGNARGNRWSRKHVTLDPDVDKKEFWRFSWDQIGRYDLPAIIDHILESTGADKLHYLGHSQGTTVFFVMASERPEYNDKIRLMSALAPVAYMYHMFNPYFRLISKYEEYVTSLANRHGVYEFLPNTPLMELIGSKFCNEESPMKAVCTNIAFLICGYDTEQFNSTLMPVILTNFPAGTSLGQQLHYAQSIKYGFFRRWDYHSEEDNQKMYGQSIPPVYNMAKITAPVALHYGQNDWMTSVADVTKLRDELPNVVFDNKIAYKAFNHLDFLFAKDVVELLYNDVIAIIEQY